VRELLRCKFSLTPLYVHSHQHLKAIGPCSPSGSLAGVLHTIIFNRALGPVEPKEVDSELFDVTYVSSLLAMRQYQRL